MLRTIAFFLATIAFTAEARTVKLDLSVANTANARLATSSSAAATASASIGLGVVRQHRLSAGAAKVSGLSVGDEIVFTLFDDKELTVTLAKETPALSGRSFLGRIDNALGALGCVILETDAGIVLDVTDFEHDRVWQVVSDENGVTVREVKPLKNGQCGNDTVSPATTSHVAKTCTRSCTVACASQMVLPKTASVSGTKPTVDILINYDTDAAKWANANGGGLWIFAETAVQKMNTAIANTDLDAYFQFRLVGVYEVGKSADGNPQLALYLSQGRNVNYGGTMVSGWSEVLTERDRVHADIVCTLCYMDMSGYSSYTSGIGNSLVKGSNAASCGFNACLIQCVADSHTMTHEVGHNMGAGHSDKMADASNCGPQYYGYSSGYYFTAKGTAYYTIMAYNSDGYGNYYTSVPYFSSPNHYYEGVAVGTEEKNDNTRTLYQNYQMVVNNRTGTDVHIHTPYVSKTGKAATKTESGWTDEISCSGCGVILTASEALPSGNDAVGWGLDAESYDWATDETYPWSRVTDLSCDGVDSARSCEMSGWSTSWVETKVNGPATLEFKLLLRSYHGSFNVLTDGTVAYTYGGSSYSSSGSDWVSVSVGISSGVHTIRLQYTHVGAGWTSGGNGAWVDQLQFVGGSPYVDVGDDPIPELTNPTTAQIETVLKKATDSKLATHITSGTEYDAFRTWSGKVQPHGGGSAVGAAGVMAAPHAWLSYALGSATLLNAAPTDDDLTIEKFEPRSESGKFDFTVGVEGVSVGSEASKENLKQVFGLKGGITPDPSGFTSDNVDITFGTPSDGKVKFSAGPKDTSAKTFFMKVKLAE